MCEKKKKKKNTLVKVEVLIKRLYSSKNEKVQALKCSQIMKVTSSLLEDTEPHLFFGVVFRVVTSFFVLLHHFSLVTLFT